MRVFFDVDGTIIHYATRIYDLYAAYARSKGFRALSKARYLQKKAEGASEKLIARETFLAEAVEPYLTWKRAHIENSKALSMDTLVPAIKAVLAALRKHHTLIVFSSRQSKKQLIDQLTRLTIAKQFSDIICVPNTADQRNNKAVALQKYLTKHHIQSRDAVVVGDTELDITAAKQSSVRAIAVSWGLRAASFLMQHGAHTVVDHPGELVHLLGR